MTRRALAGLLLCCAGTAPAVENFATLARLAKVRRVYVEPLTGGAAAVQVRDMLIAALANSGLYTVTEEPENAEATLRGSASEEVFTENHSSSDSISVGTRAVRSAPGVTAGQREASHSQERRHEAVASVRLVDREGDVIWSTTQESTGGKFRGALADVAEKTARDLTEQTKRVRRLVLEMK